MSLKEKRQRKAKSSSQQLGSQVKAQVSDSLHSPKQPAAFIEQAQLDAGFLTTSAVYQLQRTLGNRSVGKLLLQPVTLIQRASLGDYKDANPQHDPSLLDKATIEGTNEYKALMNPKLIWQWKYKVTAEEALLTCRLILRALREGTAVNWKNEAKLYLAQARAQMGTSKKAETMANDLNWRNQSPGLTNTEFGDWLLSGGAEPDAKSGVMNCWELVMFSAFKAGFTTKSKLQALYKQFAADIPKDLATAVTNFENALKKGKENVYDPANPDSPKPLAGDVVIFDTLAAHVVIATGNPLKTGEIEVMSLWTQNSKNVFRTTIEWLLLNSSAKKPVRFFSPNW